MVGNFNFFTQRPQPTNMILLYTIMQIAASAYENFLAPKGAFVFPPPLWRDILMAKHRKGATSMKSIGLVGCGNLGSLIAQGVQNHLSQEYILSLIHI